MAKEYNALGGMIEKDLKKVSEKNEPKKKESKKKYSAKKEIRSETAALLLTPSLKEALVDMAWREHKSFNSYVTEILEKHVKRKYKKED